MIQEDCSICLQQIKRRYKTVPCCKKKFHKKCIQNWLKNNDTCPLCRSQIELPAPRSYRVFRCFKFCLYRRLFMMLIILSILCSISWICLNSDDENYQVLGLFLGFIIFSLMITAFYQLIRNIRDFRERVNTRDLNNFFNTITIDEA